MSLFVNNDNNIVLSRLRDPIDPNTDIEDASPIATLCEYNKFVISNISAASNAVVTLDTAHNFQNGDRVLINRCVGRETANGKHEISSVTEFGFTLLGVDTSLDDPLVAGTGICYRIVPGGVEELPMVWEEDYGYYAVYDESIELIPGQQYVSFVEELTLDFEVEFKETAKVRTRG